MKTTLSKTTITITAFLSTFTTPIHAATTPAKKPSFYQAPKSSSTTRDPDVPKYAKPLSKGDLPLPNKPNWLDFGADYRLRYEYRDNDLRRKQALTDNPFLQRTRVYLGIHDIADPFRFAVELQDARRFNGKFPKDNRDFNYAELTRLQGELYFRDALGEDSLGNNRPVSLRYGIQNFEFLDRRLLGNNQWRNTANTFVGFRGTLGQESNDWQLDLLGVRPLSRNIDSTDTPVSGQTIYAAIGHWRKWSKIITLEPFYLALDQDKTSTATKRFVHSPGLRAYGFIPNSHLDFDTSFISQFGDNEGKSIHAWGSTAELGYTFDHEWKPRLSVFHGFASGDTNAKDNRVQRFEKFYGFGRPWSASDYIVFENIQTEKIRFEFAPTEKLRIDFGYSWYQLANSHDRVTNFNNITDPSGRSGSTIGREFDIRARWQINSHLETTIGYSHFDSGNFTQKFTNRNQSDFAYVEIQAALF